MAASAAARSRAARAAAIGAAALAGAGGLFLLGRAILREMAQDRAMDRTDDGDSPESHAQRLIGAFNPDTPFGWGTDEALVRDTVRAVPHKAFWEDVKTAYRRLSKGGNLMADMAGELSLEMMREINLIIDMLPKDRKEAESRDPRHVTAAQLEAWAERLKKAADYQASFLLPFGTDEQAIYAVLEELPYAKTACALDAVYRRRYGTGLLRMLTDEMAGSELNRAYQILISKPDAKGKTLTQALTLCQ